MTDQVRGRQGMGEPQRNLPDHGVSRGGPPPPPPVTTYVVHLVMHSIAELEYEADSEDEALEMAYKDGWGDADFDLDYSEVYACAPEGAVVPDWGDVNEVWTPDMDLPEATRERMAEAALEAQEARTEA